MDIEHRACGQRYTLIREKATGIHDVLPAQADKTVLICVSMGEFIMFG